ncbi:CLUMA_CG004504, isoform A [Clunio marinus]|uniref:CLUMA_CG004504, isoform A n=1 Tax=Clunio marinus TaxID=568069 RepID=A0A1J1HWC3_9DIPT|nr:CLUMA_CG004504, isoform A [Clunio marinus]
MLSDGSSSPEILVPAQFRRKQEMLAKMYLKSIENFLENKLNEKAKDDILWEQIRSTLTNIRMFFLGKNPKFVTTIEALEAIENYLKVQFLPKTKKQKKPVFIDLTQSDDEIENADENSNDSGFEHLPFITPKEEVLDPPISSSTDLRGLQTDDIVNDESSESLQNTYQDSHEPQPSTSTASVNVPIMNRRKSVGCRPTMDLPSIAEYKIKHNTLRPSSTYAKPNLENHQPRNIISLPDKIVPKVSEPCTSSAAANTKVQNNNNNKPVPNKKHLGTLKKFDPKEEAIKLDGIKERLYIKNYLGILRKEEIEKECREKLSREMEARKQEEKKEKLRKRSKSLCITNNRSKPRTIPKNKQINPENESQIISPTVYDNIDKELALLNSSSPFNVNNNSRKRRIESKSSSDGEDEIYDPRETRELVAKEITIPKKSMRLRSKSLYYEPKKTTPEHDDEYDLLREIPGKVIRIPGTKKLPKRRNAIDEPIEILTPVKAESDEYESNQQVD